MPRLWHSCDRQLGTLVTQVLALLCHKLGKNRYISLADTVRTSKHKCPIQAEVNGEEYPKHITTEQLCISASQSGLAAKCNTKQFHSGRIRSGTQKQKD